MGSKKIPAKQIKENQRSRRPKKSKMKTKATQEECVKQ
jgi:hypothetical protein